MRDVKIIRVRSMKSARRQREKATLEGADAFIVPKKKVKETYSHYVRRVYNANKDFFQKREFTGRAVESNEKRDYKHFKQEVTTRGTALGLGTEQAVLNAVRSNYMSGEQVARMNAIQGLKEAGQWKEFREMTKVGGRYTKFDMSKMTWSTQEQSYVYEVGGKKVYFGWVRTKGKSPTTFQMWSDEDTVPPVAKTKYAERYDKMKLF